MVQEFVSLAHGRRLGCQLKSNWPNISMKTQLVLEAVKEIDQTQLFSRYNSSSVVILLSYLCRVK